MVNNLKQAYIERRWIKIPKCVLKMEKIFCKIKKFPNLPLKFSKYAKMCSNLSNIFANKFAL